MRIRTGRAAVLAAALVGACGCGSRSGEPARSGKPVVYTVNYPLKYFAERIGGDAVEVRFPAPKNEDPEFWRPDAATVEAYQKADLVLLNGAGYAKWTTTASLPLGSSADTSAAFKDQFIPIGNAVTHSHGPSGEHSHAGTASITWLDFRQASAQARAVKDALVRLRPDQADGFNTRFAALEADLSALDREMEALAAQAGSRPLVASHPVYHYWARRYGVNLKSVHWEPDAVPSDEQTTELRKLLAGHPAKWMVWEDEPIPAAAEKLKGVGVASVVFNPCGNTPASGDFLDVMRKNIASVRPAFARPKQ
jgi:zinc transport system substrate-binding protein